MLELQRNLFVLRRWWWLLVAAAVIGAVVAYEVTKMLVQQEYQGSATVAMAPPPQGPNGLYVTMLTASADAQLVSTLATAQAAQRSLPVTIRSSIDASTLSSRIDGTASVDNELLFVKARWTDPALAVQLTNAVAKAFIAQETRRLERRYQVIHAGLATQERHLAALIASPGATGAARSWLQAQYADTASKIYQQDADARIQASTQEASLQLAQPASGAVKVGPKATVNAALGGALAFLLALLFAFAATRAYPQTEASESLPPVLKKVGD